MKIGIIGAGNIGGTAAKLWAKAGHEIAISNSRGPETLSELVAELGPNARAVTVEEAAAFGDVVLESIPFGKYTTLLVAPLAGKIVIDTSNYYPQRDGNIDLKGLATSELVAQYLKGAKVVKAFNTIYFKHLESRGRTDLPLSERIAIFIAGDDAAAKETVAELIREIGFAPADTGSLHDSTRQEPGTPLYNSMTLAEAQKLL